MEIFKEWLKQDEIFASAMKEIAKNIRKNNLYYFDTDKLKNIKLHRINFCHEIDQSQQLILGQSWAYPGGHKTFQHKNPLFVKDDNLFLLNKSRGIVLSKAENVLLLEQGICNQHNIEINISLSVEDFLSLI